MTQGTPAKKPPMQPSDEAEPESIPYARAQGEIFAKTLRHMTDDIAHDGGQTRAGEYLIAYAVENAEGMYDWRDGELVWNEPEEENVHVEVAVCDGADGRFIPGLKIMATLIDADGREIGTHEQPFLWHPWLYHYGRNWKVPGDGTYTLRVRVDPSTFSRHDKINGCRYRQKVEAEFTNVKIKTGRK